MPKSNVTLSVGGGSITTKDRLIISPHEQGIIKHLYASKYFLGAKSISNLGLLESDPIIINYDNLLMRRAEKIIVLADSSKFNYKEGCFSSINLEKINTIITDNNIKKNDMALLEKNNVELIAV